MNDNKAEYGPLRKYCGDSNIQLTKKLRDTVTESLIEEKLPNLFSYMNKSYAIKQNRKTFKNGTIAVINYDLHGHGENNREKNLYCVIEKQKKDYCRSFGWTMTHTLITAHDIEMNFNIESHEFNPCD